MGFPGDPHHGPITRTTRSGWAAFIQDKMAQWFMAGWRHCGGKGAPPALWDPRPHAYGGTRMGDNREDQCGQPLRLFPHEVPNLGIVRRVR